MGQELGNGNGDRLGGNRNGGWGMVIGQKKGC